MTGPIRRWGTAMTALAGVCAAGAHFAASEASPRAEGALARETDRGGVVARLPFIGTLAWRCDEERRFSTRLIHPAPGASLTVGLESDSVRVWRRRRVDPVPAPRDTVIGPFPAQRRQVWTIRYHHKPATLTVAARLRFAAPASRSECVVSRADIRVRRTAH
jgi:hypothetical protein